MMTHYFIAIPIPDYLKEIIVNWQVKCKKVLPYQQWTYKSDFHITLKFLGYVDQEQLNELRKELQYIHHFSKFNINIGSLNTFGLKDAPRVLWVGVDKNKQILKLQRIIDHNICRKLGFPIDTRAYQPHITIGKKWIGEKVLDNSLTILKNEINQSFVLKVNDVVLYEINPSKTPKYRIVESFPLSGGGNNRSVN